MTPDNNTASEIHTPYTPEAAPKRSNLPLIILIAILLIAGAGYYVYANHFAHGGVIGTVDGDKIYRDEFDQAVRTIEEGARQQNIDTTDAAVRAEIETQAFQTVVDNTILRNAAKEAGAVATEEEVQAKYDELLAQVGGEEELARQLAELNLSEEDLRKNIKDRVLVDNYLVMTTDIEILTVTEEEVTAFIASLNATDLPSLEEIRPQVEAQVLMQKQQQLLAQLIETLRSQAVVESKM